MNLPLKLARTAAVSGSSSVSMVDIARVDLCGKGFGASSDCVVSSGQSAHRADAPAGRPAVENSGNTMRHSRLASILTTLLLVIAGISSITSNAAAAEPAARPAITHHRAGVLAWSRFDNFSDGTARIVRADQGGNHVRGITHPATGVLDDDPKISPDGRHVLFERQIPSQSVAEIGIVGIDGRGERILNLRCTDPCIAVEFANWTPDGHHLVYSRVIGPIDPTTGGAVSELLYRSGLHGGTQTRISSFNDVYHASFAPSGYIIFLRPNPRDSDTAVFRMDADGRHVRQLTPWSVDADLADASPATSGPTKDAVVFETHGHGPQDGTAQAVATVPATCRSLARCTRQIRYLTSPKALPDQNFNPSWSPNGRKIIYCHFSFVAPGPVIGDIWIMRFNGADKDAVSTDPRFEFRPDWGLAARQS